MQCIVSFYGHLFIVGVARASTSLPQLEIMAKCLARVMFEIIICAVCSSVQCRPTGWWINTHAPPAVSCAASYDYVYVRLELGLDAPQNPHSRKQKSFRSRVRKRGSESVDFTRAYNKLSVSFKGRIDYGFDIS